MQSQGGLFVVERRYNTMAAAAQSTAITREIFTVLFIMISAA
jgi:hypothetical protein